MHNFLVANLRPLVLGFFAGVLLASLAGNFLGPIWWLSIFLAASFFFWGAVASAERVRLFSAGVFLLAFTFGLILTSFAKQSSTIKLPPPDSRKIVSIAGTITDEPDDRDRDAQLTFRPDGSIGRLLLIVPLFSNYHYGDRLRVTGRPELPQPFETEAERTFDYPAYLAARGISAIMRSPKIENLRENGGYRFVSQLFALKAAFLNRLDQVLPEPESSLLGSLVVGGKRSLGPVWQERFRQAGLIHLVVLSGYNLTIIGAATAIFFTTLRLRRSLTLILSALAIILFSIMVGGGASVIRAAVMALLVVLARLTGRNYEAGRALATAMVVMVAINPLILVNDIGFQLSCLATAGLIYGSPLLERRLNFIPARFGLRSVVVTTVAAQLAVLPWILRVMGQVSPYALLTNVLVVPIVPLTMLFAALIGLAGLLLPPLAFVIMPFGYLAAAYIFKITSLATALPGAALTITTFPLALVILIYLGYFWLWRRAQPKLSSLVAVLPR